MHSPSLHLSPTHTPCGVEEVRDKGLQVVSSTGKGQVCEAILTRVHVCVKF